MVAPSVVWFRDDLRLADNPALSAAAARGGPVLAVYVLDEQSPGIRPLGGAARWWLHGSLVSLTEQLAERGVQLVLRRGAASTHVTEIVRAAGAAAVLWNRRYGGAERAVDTALMASLRTQGVDVESFAASLLHEPGTLQTGAGRSYSVFTPFWRALQRLPPPRAPLPAPGALPAASGVVDGDPLEEWGLQPRDPDWAAGLRQRWTPGEPSALTRMDEFLRDDLGHYDTARDRPAVGATSLLSPRLRWGELSPHQVWHAAGRHGATAEPFLRELGWREFAWHTLFHFPDLATRNWRPEFDRFPWPPVNNAHVAAWQRGRTGIGLVDAGMRELWRTGFMHNRVRMVAASFLTKNLLIPWWHGEQWFWDTLVDADAAANPFNWQWVAGSGADAAPYFRVFNPDLQAARFDPEGEYTGTWMSDAVDPIVDVAHTRGEALAAYARMRDGVAE